MKKMEFTYDIERHEKFFFNSLSEQDKRKFVGLEAMKQGYNGVADVSKKYGINKHTVRRGKKELLAEIVLPRGRIRKAGGGRKKKLKA